MNICSVMAVTQLSFLRTGFYLQEKNTEGNGVFRIAKNKLFF
jgi:hypothetical protein